MVADDYIKACACLVAWEAGKNDGAPAMIAVLFALRNRASQLGWNWMQAVNYQTEEKLDFFDFPDPREPEFQKVLQSIDMIYSGDAVDTYTNGATNWGISYGNRTAKVGQLDFWS